MRLDVFLKHSRLVKRRPLAKKMCDEGRIQIDGSPAKASQTVQVGSRIEVRFPEFVREAIVLEVPTGPVSKARSAELIEIVDERGIDLLQR